MRKLALYLVILGLVVTIALTGMACKTTQAAETTQAAAETTQEAAKELDKVRVGLSAFQDVMSIYVGIERGFFKEEGIELDITRTDWLGANELLIAGQVDIATQADSDTISQNAVGQDTTLAFPLFFFAGTGVMFDPVKHKDWKTFETFYKENNNDLKIATNKTLGQIKEDNATVGISFAGEFATFALLCEVAGYKTDEFKTVDLSNEELVPALISGSIDVMLSGIPQRLAAVREGYIAMVDQSYFPSMVNHAGFGASRKWVDDNFDLAIRIEKAILKTLDYVQNNPDEAFPIISKNLKESGTVVSTEELKGVWNQMEFFPNSKETYESWVVDPAGKFYWKDRYEGVINSFIAEGKLEEGLIKNLEDLLYGMKVINAIK